MSIFGRATDPRPIDFTSDGALRELLASLRRYGLQIDDIPSPELRAQLRAVKAQQVREEIDVARDRAAVHVATTGRGRR